MHVVRVRNVAEALPAGLDYLLADGVREESRAGPVLVAPGPVTTVYEHPTERVLLSAVRDANPFFHLAEAVWMLAGRSDTKFLDNFVSDFGKRFAEPGGAIHGAYGHRWRQAFGFDQLDHVVEVLRRDPTSRQCVIQMWDTRSELLMTPGDDDFNVMKAIGESDLRGVWRDRPCNTHAYLRVKTLSGLTPAQVLDLTVLCRSNDIIWGAYGANAVHFSVLQEYLAAHIGMGVGTYYQVSNNYHAYEVELERLRRRVPANQDGRWSDLVSDNRCDHMISQPIVDVPEKFDIEARYVLDLYESLDEVTPPASAHLQPKRLTNEFLSWTLWPMLMAHRNYRSKNYHEAERWLSYVEAADWRVAAQKWIARRAK
jgi:thymidylate synthase